MDGNFSHLHDLSLSNFAFQKKSFPVAVGSMASTAVHQCRTDSLDCPAMMETDSHPVSGVTVWCLSQPFSEHNTPTDSRHLPHMGQRANSKSYIKRQVTVNLQISGNLTDLSAY